MITSRLTPFLLKLPVECLFDLPCSQVTHNYLQWLQHTLRLTCDHSKLKAMASFIVSIHLMLGPAFPSFMVFFTDSSHSVTKLQQPQFGHFSFKGKFRHDLI